MITPTLLLSPDESRDANGAVIPTTVGTVNVVAGQYGNAWQPAAGGYKSVPTAGHIDRIQGTLFVRLLAPASLAASTGILGARNTTPRLWLYGSSGMGITQWVGGASRATGLSFVPSAHQVLAMRWSDDATQVFLNGVGGTIWDDGIPTVLDADLRFGTSGTVASWTGNVESLIVTSNLLTNSDITRISTMTEAWTWENIQTPDGPTPAERARARRTTKNRKLKLLAALIGSGGL